MKKYSILMTLALTAACLGGCSQKEGAVSYIGTDAARQLALADAGLSSGQIRFTEADMGTRNGMDYYHLVFTDDVTIYEYDIEALTGTVIESHTTDESAADNAVPAGETTAAGDNETTGGAANAAEDNRTTGAGGTTDTDTAGTTSANGNAADSGETVSAEGNGPVMVAEISQIYTTPGSTSVQNTRSGQNSGSGQGSTSGGNSGSAQGTMLTEAEAKAKALAHAGLTSGQVTFTKCRLDYEDGRQVYEIEFHSADLTEYDYDIDPYTGSVIEYDRDIEHRVSAPSSGSASSGGNSGSAQGNSSGQNSGSAQGTMLTEAEAKAKALAHAGLTSGQVTFTKCRLDYDDGRQVYDIEFYGSDYTEYDYEVDAYTGDIISFDYDAEQAVPSAPASSSGSRYLSAEQAKALALSQVPGATSDDIYEFETDRDDGRIKYEGKLYYGGMEYEFEIDAYSSAIISWDCEHHDSDHHDDDHHDDHD